jgi:hypothetical protein
VSRPPGVDYAELVRRCTGPGGAVGTDPVQNLAVVPHLIREAALDAGSPYATGATRATVVLGVDGISWEVAAATLQPDVLCPLTAPVPSTSVAAWITAVSGLELGQHQVPGPVYRHPDGPADKVWNIFRERAYGWGDDWSSGGEPTAGLRLGPWPTVFGELAAAGVRSRLHLADISTMPGTWTDALVSGATDLVPPVLDWDAARMEPATIVRATIDEVDDSLKVLDRRPGLIWIHVNLDEYIHRLGYDASVSAAVRRLGEAAGDWADRGVTVLLHSDHGQIRTRCPDRLAAAWQRVESPRYCTGPAGGAGRIRWLHCREGLAGEVHAILAAAGGDGLLVRYRDEVPELAGAPEGSIGEVVLIATGSDFPVPDPEYLFEHGGLTAAEMIAPLAIWRPRCR